MVRSKVPAKKQQKHGVDFKKIKRKLGRKLPPPKNATNTDIKSKAIILPEQSVAAEKAGLALSKKGLTLKELLQQTSHHNAKVRKDALLGIRDLFQSHPAELRLHKCAVVEKLRICIADDDKLVRETLYQLFKSVIFPSCNEDNQGPLASLLMAYICSTMTNLSTDVRLMAFKFFDLLVQYYPPTFLLYAEKILQNYMDIIQNNKLFVQDKGKLKVALSGLVNCLSLLPCNNINAGSCEKDSSQDEVLHGYERDATKGVEFAHITGKLKEIIAVLIKCFQDFIPLVHAMPVLDAQSFDCMHHILCSINHVIKFFIDRNSQGLSVSVPASEGPDLTIWDQAMASMLLKKLLSVFPLNPMNHLSDKGDDRYFILNSAMTEIFLRVTELFYPPADLCDKFLIFIETKLLGKVTNSRKPGRSMHEKNLLSLLPFLPKLLSRLEHDWREGLLQAFTVKFKDCKPESPLKLACISTIEEMIIPKEDILYVSASDPEIMSYLVAWIDELSSLLIQLGDKHPLSTQAVLRLLLRLGQIGFRSPSRTFEDDIRNYYSTYQGENTWDVSYGPFVTLPREAQELSLSCLYYFDSFSPSLLKSIVSCCLYPYLKPSLVYRIVEVIQSAHRAGFIQIADHISFFISLVARFKVFPERVYMAMECDARATNRNRDTFKTLTRMVCSCLLELGDRSLVIQILEPILLKQIILKPPLDNACAILRIICALDSNPTRLSEYSITTLSEFLPAYLIEVVNSISEDDSENSSSINMHTCRYYLVPGFFLFERCSKLVDQVLSKLRSVVSECTSALLSEPKRETDGNSLNTIKAIVSIILLIHGDVKARKIISSSKSEIDLILHDVLSLQSSKNTNLTIEGKHKMKIAGERLRIASSSLLV